VPARREAVEEHGGNKYYMVEKQAGSAVIISGASIQVCY